MDDRDSRIRARAYALWEAEGRPEGRHHDHWAEAESEMGPEAQPQMAAGLAEAAPAFAPAPTSDLGPASPRDQEARPSSAREARVRSDQEAG